MSEANDKLYDQRWTVAWEAYKKSAAGADLLYQTTKLQLKRERNQTRDIAWKAYCKALLHSASDPVEPTPAPEGVPATPYVSTERPPRATKREWCVVDCRAYHGMCPDPNHCYQQKRCMSVVVKEAEPTLSISDCKHKNGRCMFLTYCETHNKCAVLRDGKKS